MGRPTIPLRTASKESYEIYCQENPSDNISFEEYRNIIYTWNEMLMTHILDTGEKVKLPYGLGELSINKKKTVRFFKSSKTGKEHCILPINWGQSRKYGKIIYILNTHTDGFRFKWFWFKDKCRIKYPEIWRFKPARKLSTMLNKYLTIKKDKNYTDVYNEWYRGKM